VENSYRMSGWRKLTSAKDEGSLHARSVSDRERIFEYLRERSAAGAKKVIASIRETARQLEVHPLSGYETEHPNVRVIFVTRYP
jgi:plasmid stabilization system protein ParE